MRQLTHFTGRERDAFASGNECEQRAEVLDVMTKARCEPGRLTTGAAFSPAGSRLVVRTYNELFFYKYARNGKLRLDGPPCWIGAVEPQGEAVDFLDERTLVLTSESLPTQVGPVLRVSCDGKTRTP